MTTDQTVALFLPSLSNGGAERVMLNIAHGIARQKQVKVDMVLVEKEGPYLSQVSEDVRIVNLASKRIIKSIPALIRYLRSTKPVAVLSALDPANLVLIWAVKMAGTQTKAIVTEHCNFSSALEGSVVRRAQLLPTLIKWFYPWADDIVAVSNGVADSLTEATGVKRDIIKVIGNPVITPSVIEKASMIPEHPWFHDDGPPIVLGIGRLTYQKNFHLLIRSLKRVSDSLSVRLMILGEGEDRESLVNLAKELGIENKVMLPGFVDNPYAYMSAASLFVLSSRYEGLPTVLIEALYCDTPVISTDCPSGPQEILMGGKYGKLVPVGDEDALSDAIVASLQGEHPEKCTESWQPFTMDRVISQYNGLIN